MTRINLFHPKTEKTMLKRLLRALGLGKPADLTPTAHVRPAPAPRVHAAALAEHLGPPGRVVLPYRRRVAPPAAPVPPFLRHVVPPGIDVSSGTEHDTVFIGSWASTVPEQPEELECKRDDPQPDTRPLD